MLSVRASTNQRAMQAGAENTRGMVNTAHLEAEAGAWNTTGKAIGALGEAYVKEMKERENRKLLAAINEFNKGMDEIKDPPPDGGGEDSEGRTPVPEMPASFAEQAKRVQDDVLARSGIRDRAVKERFYLQSERNVIAREELLQNRRKEKAQLERDERVRSAGATAVELAVASGHDGDIDNAIASQLELLESSYADEGNEALLARRAAAVRDTIQAAAGARIERGDYTGAKDIVSRYKGELDAADYSRLQKVVGGYEEAGKRDAANRARYERFGDDAAAAHAEIMADDKKGPLAKQREIRSYDAYAKMEKRRRDNAVTIAQKGCVDEISAMVKEGTVSEAALEGMRNRLLDDSGLTGSERERLEDSLGDMYGRMINAPRSYPLVKAGLIRAAIEGELSFEQVEDAWESGELSKRDYVYFLDKADALRNESNDMADDAFDKVWLKKLDGMGLDDYSKAEAMGVINQSLDDSSKKGMDRIEAAGKLMELGYADKETSSNRPNVGAQTKPPNNKKVLGFLSGAGGRENLTSGDIVVSNVKDQQGFQERYRENYRKFPHDEFKENALKALGGNVDAAAFVDAHKDLLPPEQAKSVYDKVQEFVQSVKNTDYMGNSVVCLSAGGSLKIIGGSIGIMVDLKTNDVYNVRSINGGTDVLPLEGEVLQFKIYDPETGEEVIDDKLRQEALKGQSRGTTMGIGLVGHYARSVKDDGTLGYVIKGGGLATNAKVTFDISHASLYEPDIENKPID